MKPYSSDEAFVRLYVEGTLFTLTKLKEDGEVECFILEPEEVTIRELRDDKQKLR